MNVGVRASFIEQVTVDSCLKRMPRVDSIHAAFIVVASFVGSGRRKKKMTISASRSRLWFVSTFALVFYSNGAAFVESFVNYPTWKLIGPNEFTTYHRAIDPLVVRYLALPMLIGFLMTIGLVWLRPMTLPRGPVLAAIALQLVVVVATVAIHLPIQAQLSREGLSVPLVERLIVTNFWLRRLPYLGNAALFFWMMVTLLKGPRQPSLSV